MTKWSFGYEVIRYYVRLAFWLTHKRVIVTGRSLIPKGKPILFAANHQNALMDPLAVACTNSFQTLWLARADIFKSKAAQAFLKYLKMLPIYRIRDGKDNLSNNEDIFGQVIQMLESNQSVALFPEAAHSGKRQMLAHKKAIPRIALDAEAKNNFDLGLQVVPVGIYYSHYWLFNRTLIVQYGKPINVDSYKDEYTENPQKAMLSLRNEIHDRIIPLIIQINSKNLYQEYEDICQLVGNEYAKTHFCNINHPLWYFYAKQDLIAKLELLENQQPHQFEKILKETSSYFHAIHEVHLSDEQVRKARKARISGIIVRLVSVIFTFPLFAFGFLFNAIPFFVPRMILRKKVKDPAFLSTFNFGVGLVAFPVSYLIEGSLIYVFTGSLPVSLLTLILMPFGGKLAFKLLLSYQDIITYLKLLCKNKDLLKQKVNHRKELIGLIIEMIN